MDARKRGLLKGIAGASTAGVFAVAGKVLGVRDFSILPKASLRGGSGRAPSALNVTPVQKAMIELDGLRSLRYGFKIDGIDMDIHVLKSVSPAIKCQMQVNRDKYIENIMEKLNKIVYPNMPEPSRY